MEGDPGEWMGPYSLNIFRGTAQGRERESFQISYVTHPSIHGLDSFWEKNKDGGNSE